MTEFGHFDSDLFPQFRKIRKFEEVENLKFWKYRNFQQWWIIWKMNFLRWWSLLYSRASKDDVSKGSNYKLCIIWYTEQYFDEVMLLYLWSILKLGFKNPKTKLKESCPNIDLIILNLFYAAILSTAFHLIILKRTFWLGIPGNSISGYPSQIWQASMWKENISNCKIFEWWIFLLLNRHKIFGWLTVRDSELKPMKSSGHHKYVPFIENRYLLQCVKSDQINHYILEFIALRRFGETQALFRDFVKFSNFRKLFSWPW